MHQNRQNGPNDICQACHALYYSFSRKSRGDSGIKSFRKSVRRRRSAANRRLTTDGQTSPPLRRNVYADWSPRVQNTVVHTYIIILLLQYDCNNYHYDAAAPPRADGYRFIFGTVRGFFVHRNCGCVYVPAVGIRRVIIYHAAFLFLFRFLSLFIFLCASFSLRVPLQRRPGFV